MAKLSKKQVTELKERLALEPGAVWEAADAARRKEIFATAERYKAFLDRAKTERLAVAAIREMAEQAGFRPLEGKGRGRRFYSVYKGKLAALAVLGRAKPGRGLRVLGSHLDAPRLDLKMRPLYESHDLAFLKTHYYGGIKKYQWLARPLALHGVVCTAGGQSVELHIGDDPADPVFTVLDILPHLSRKSQGAKKVNEAFEAERMNLLIGGLPLEAKEGQELVKLAVLERLEREHGLREADLVSAELEIVPAGPARDVGLDRGLIGAYGQDDRASAFACLEAVLGLKDPPVPCLALFVDKEEIGSEGVTSARSSILQLLTARLLDKAGEKPGYLAVLEALGASRAVSADVAPGFDPDFPEVHEKLNAGYLGRGVALTKYTGSGGKYGASEANAEYVAWLRGVWDAAGVPWQTAGLGKVDEGGGGTIAKLLAVHGMEVVDAGPPLLSMHSPFEISHKADIHATCQAFRAFLRAEG
jgi:aspartyl aminopeptidase